MTQEERTFFYIKESHLEPVNGDSWAFYDGVWYYKNGFWYFPKTK